MSLFSSAKFASSRPVSIPGCQRLNRLVKLALEQSLRWNCLCASTVEARCCGFYLVDIGILAPQKHLGSRRNGSIWGRTRQSKMNLKRAARANRRNGHSSTLVQAITRHLIVHRTKPETTLTLEGRVSSNDLPERSENEEKSAKRSFA